MQSLLMVCDIVTDQFQGCLSCVHVITIGYNNYSAGYTLHSIHDILGLTGFLS